jgi:hypothetical protein
MRPLTIIAAVLVAAGCSRGSSEVAVPSANGDVVNRDQVEPVDGKVVRNVEFVVTFAGTSRDGAVALERDGEPSQIVVQDDAGRLVGVRLQLSSGSGGEVIATGIGDPKGVPPIALSAPTPFSSDAPVVLHGTGGYADLEVKVAWPSGRQPRQGGGCSCGPCPCCVGSPVCHICCGIACTGHWCF